FPAHFETENTDGLVSLERHMLGDVKAETGLSQPGARGDDDQICGMQARAHSVEFRETCFDTGDRALAVRDFLDLLVDLAYQDINGLKTGAELPACDLEDRVFYIIQDLLGTVLALITPRHRFAGDLDQASQYCLFLYDIHVMFNVCGEGKPIGQAGQVGGASSAFQLIGALQLFLQRDEVNRAGTRCQAVHLLEYSSVAFEIEVFLAQKFLGGEHRLVIQENRAQDRALGLEVIRKGALERNIWRLGESHGLLPLVCNQILHKTPSREKSI